MSAITMDMVSSNYIDYPCHYVLDRNALRLQKVDRDLSCHDTTDPHHEVNSNLTIIILKNFACGAIKNRGGGRLINKPTDRKCARQISEFVGLVQTK